MSSDLTDALPGAQHIVFSVQRDAAQPCLTEQQIKLVALEQLFLELNSLQF